MPTKAKEELEHVSLQLPRSLLSGVRVIMKSHEEEFGFSLTLSAAIRKLISDGINYNESQKTRKGFSKLNP